MKSVVFITVTTAHLAAVDSDIVSCAWVRYLSHEQGKGFSNGKHSIDWRFACHVPVTRKKKVCWGTFWELPKSQKYQLIRQGLGWIINPLFFFFPTYNKGGQ